MNSSYNSSMSSNSSIGDTTINLKSKLMSIIRKSNTIFVGEYLERRLVKNHPSAIYKDIVVVDKDEEIVGILKQLYDVVHKELNGDKSLGITRTIIDDEVQDYKLWVDLESITFGKYWFRIKSVKIYDNTVQLQLKSLKSFHNSSRRSTIQEDYQEFDINQILTYHNLVEATKFIAVVLMSLITLLANFLYYFADFSIKITHELSNLVKALTPILFGLYDFLTRCVGGLYWLIFMLFSGTTVAPPPRQPIALMPSVRRSRGGYDSRNVYERYK
ncbi:uncharacterized protein LOC103576573 [Microplitis demolitor]|uniref:uncharacterized protein LOC103576573 n=1 Tax=Microplitis demolitor TaxID=69319 RepID=UPI0004CD7E99|nr:uncharacterized protein LOC103576573 [Microplitis demolitor]